jgi:outer membrane lipoprotein-sorting protein
MSLPRRIFPGIAATVAMLLGVLPNAGCIVTFHRPIRNHAKGHPLQMADKDALAARILNLYNSVNSFIATVDMTPSVGSVYKGEITDYKDVRGYILFRKPADIRIQADYPVIRTTAFDMVSNGTEFKFYLPAKNRFVVGANDAPANSPNKLENLRPQAFLESLLIRPIDPAKEQSLLMDDTDEDIAVYILVVFGNDAKGNAVALRSIWFDRVDLSIIKQQIYAPNSNIINETRYASWTDYSGVSFPKSLQINRPIDGYGVTISLVDMKMNVPVTDKQFELAQPAGTTLQTIGSPASVPTAAPNPKTQK